MSHTALARRYRPRSFAEVATQEHVSETLRRAVASDRVGHAYLFCGPRGVGKTTLARVLAMALNCGERSEEAEPCGECGSCERIWSGQTSLDVVEIDAASNRGVEDARQLRERAMYAPSEDGRFKVYILDEAHMLTREAWNALLKVIEEPPSRVIFIFATTEPQKIEQTAAPILSRCQRFDFRRVGVGDITDRLKEVLASEGVTASDEALRMVARKADGGMRDALSITDQVLSMAGEDLTPDTVARILGLVAEERYLELFEILAKGDGASVFRFVEELLEHGYDLVEFYHGFMEATRTLLRIRLSSEAVPELSADARPAWDERARQFSAGDLIRMLALGSELERTGSLRGSAQPRVLLELLLLRLSLLDRTVDLEEVLDSLGGEEDEEGVRRAPRPPPEPTSPSKVAPAGTLKGELEEPSPGSKGKSGAVGTRKPKDRGREPAGGSGPSGEESSEVLQPAVSREDVWSALLQAPRGIPGGLAPFLRAAEPSWSGPNLTVRLPSGPGLERLTKPGVRKGVEHRLQELAEDPTIRLHVAPLTDPEEDGGPNRIDEAKVREDRLRELLKREPALEAAVEELDLEILD